MEQGQTIGAASGGADERQERVGRVGRAGVIPDERFGAGR
jgi:hypothetical protein